MRWERVALVLVVFSCGVYGLWKFFSIALALGVSLGGAWVLRAIYNMPGPSEEELAGKDEAFVRGQDFMARSILAGIAVVIVATSWAATSMGLRAWLGGAVLVIEIVAVFVAQHMLRKSDATSSSSREMSHKIGVVFVGVLLFSPPLLFWWSPEALAALASWAIFTMVASFPASSARLLAVGSGLVAIALYWILGLAPAATAAAWAVAWRLVCVYYAAEDELEVLLLQLRIPFWLLVGTTAGAPLAYYLISVQAVLTVLAAWVYAAAFLLGDFIPDNQSFVDFDELARKAPDADAGAKPNAPDGPAKPSSSKPSGQKKFAGKRGRFKKRS
ncbi:uncharacterized protein AMSG_02679 [Thecamonas trahens ATCC 50062]|uniref:Transmembrane protein n=1 Tax=Thecamonas trahens ATCC 50062 TaxID=461836 RepID=A0A0L0D4J9_THETB|nr:hypothetical protein AMSG_02679 [Thecamonas trahens ATCC 50062]KNC46228.1 hypothetical protein AMSG_02679 [Thecamonas trahens ATCC 50062]|eukprot:XP_013760525.1 hypothetical protein AMSG_02679 [Thecamonas trahens ATCC 50062]